MHSSPSGEKDHPVTIIVFAYTLIFSKCMYFHFYFPPFSVLFLPQRSPWQFEPVLNPSVTKIPNAFSVAAHH